MRHHRWPTFEYEWPHRQSRAHVVRLVGKLGIAYGRWHGDKLAEDEAALKAAQGHYERGDIKGEGGESIEEHRERRSLEAAVPEGWTVR